MALIEGQLAFLTLSSSTLLLAVGVRWHLVLELVVNDSPGFRQSLYRVLDFSRGPGLVDVVGLHNVLENLLLGESALSLVLASYGFYHHVIILGPSRDRHRHGNRHGNVVETLSLFLWNFLTNNCILTDFPILDQTGSSIC